MPLAVSQAYHEGNPSIPDDNDYGAGQLALESVQFTPPIDTSTTVPEYPMISRALMLPGGSTDAALADVNGDGYDDLAIAVSGSTRCISVFHGQADGVFPTYPTWNITIARNPLSISSIDVDGDETLSIIVLERRTTELDSDYIEIFTYNSISQSYELYIQRAVLYENAMSMVVGNFSGDKNDDVVIVCSQSEPSITKGIVEIKDGPLYFSMCNFHAGNGTNEVTLGRFNADSLDDIAVSNYYDSTVTVFNSPSNCKQYPTI